MKYQVRKCCDEMPHDMYDMVGKRIDLDPDPNHDGYSFLDVKYCMYCGNRLRLEAVPYKVDLSSLSAKDRALEELKTEMQK